MKRTGLIVALLLAFAVLSLRARAQDVPETDVTTNVTTNVTFHAECDCVVAQAIFYYSYTGPMDYDVYEATDLTDANGTVNDHESISGYVDEYNEQADNVAWGDSYNFSAEIDAECDPIAQPGGCEDSGGGGGGGHLAGCCCSPRCGTCGGGCCFTNCGPACGCESGPPGGSPNEVESNSGANIGNSCDQGPDLDKLLNEYYDPTSEGLPAGWVGLWPDYAVDCAAFATEVPLTMISGGSPTYEEYGLSGGDITDWGMFQFPMATDVNTINNTAAPAGAAGVPSRPIPVYEHDDIYRTPAWNVQMNGTGAPNEAHQFGAAIDFEAGSQSLWTSIAGWSEWATGSSPGAGGPGTCDVSGPVCLEPTSAQQGSVGHTHIDWRPEFVGPCPAGWATNEIPTGWPVY
ncbi:MAG: hypothetical protein ACRD1F_07995 [Terriglobales bacterium]